MERTPGIDVSRWQGEIDWRQVAEAGYRFAMIRATVGDYYTDPRFYINWNEAQEAGLLVSAYHVIVPKNTIYSQVDRLFDVLGDRRADLPLVMDVERHDKVSRAHITACVQGCLQRAEQQDGRRPVIYTAGWFWDNPEYVIPSEDWAQYDLWVANYVESLDDLEDTSASEPQIPQGWSTWKFWQYTDKATVPGVRGSANLDWFAGGYEDLVAYGAQRTVNETPAKSILEPDAPPPMGIRARVLTDVNVRSGPGVNYDRVGKLKEGDMITIGKIAGKEIWVEFAPGQWAALEFQGERFIEIE